MRTRDLGIVIGRGRPGPGNAITDVAGVRVGHATIVEGDGALVVGRGPVRTGVTVVVPHEDDRWNEPVYAGCHRLNGNGEMTGLEWVRESGLLTTPVAGETYDGLLNDINGFHVRGEHLRAALGDAHGGPVAEGGVGGGTGMICH